MFLSSYTYIHIHTEFFLSCEDSIEAICAFDVFKLKFFELNLQLPRGCFVVVWGIHSTLFWP